MPCTYKRVTTGHISKLDQLRHIVETYDENHAVVLPVSTIKALLKCTEALTAARWAFYTLAGEACDVSELHPEINELWNEGGEAHEASKLVREALEALT